MKKFIYMISVLVFMCVFSISSFAMIPYGSINDLQYFEDGPWSGLPYKYVGVGSDNTVSGLYSLTGWREGSGLGSAYYNIGAYGKTRDFYLFSGSGWHNFTVCSEDPLMELYIINLDGSVLCNALEDAFLCESGGKYFYGLSLFGGVGVGLRTGNIAYITELSPAFNGGSYHDIVVNSLPYLSGVYDGNASAVKYPGLFWYSEISLLTDSYGYSYPVYPSCALPSNPGTSMQFTFGSDGGVIHEESRYTFNFKVYNVPSGNIFLRGGDYIPATVNGNSFTASIDGRDGSISDLGVGFAMGSYGGPSAFAFVYKSSSSDDIGTIPPDDSGDGTGSPDYSSALTSISSSIKDLAGKLSAGTTTIVNNIINQTTQITNTITNTVTNMTQQITQGLSDVRQGITDKLQGVQDGINNKLQDVGDAVSGSIEDANKEQMENDQKLHDDQIQADKENTDQITGGFDNLTMESDKDRLDSSIQDYDEVEKDLVSDATDNIDEFVFDLDLSEFIAPIQDISFFMQGIFETMGPMNVAVSFSLMLSVALVLIGWYRFKSGG